MSVSVPRAALIPVLACALLAAGCSSSVTAPRTAVASHQNRSGAAALPAAAEGDIYARNLIDAMHQNLKQATSVHARTTPKDPAHVIQFDLRVNRKGQAQGSVVTPMGPMRVILIGGKGYVRLGKKALRAVFGTDPKVTAVVRGRWIEITRAGVFADILDLADMDTVIGGIPDADQAWVVADEPGKGKTGSFGRRPTMGLKVQGEAQEAFLAAEGVADLVAVVAPDSTETYADWNQDFTVKAPAHPLSAAGQKAT